MWEKDIDINQVLEIRGKSTVYLGVGAIKKIDDICAALKQRGISKVAVITGKGAYKKTGAWDYVVKAFEKYEMHHVLYNGITPNPTVEQVDEAAKLSLDFGAQAVIAIGGGSPIDAAKSAAILMEYTDKTATELYEYRFTPEKAAPIIAINLTHGTGTEIDRFAVVTVTEKEFKPVIAYDCIYPLYSINDPALMTGLPTNQTLYVSVDALNHVIEACTSKAASPFSILLAKETVRLVAKYLPMIKENPQDLTARYYLLYASMIAGVAFDNGLLHFTHALEHPLSGVNPDLTHGLGLSMLLPYVIKQIYSATSNVLADVLSPIIPGLTGNPTEAEKACEGMKQWLTEMGIPLGLTTEGFTYEDVERLTDLTFNTPSLALLLSLTPVAATREVVSTIYTESM